MKCLRLIGRQESCQVSCKNHLFYPFVIESFYLYLLCLSAAVLCYTGFQNYSLIGSTSCSCSTCCFGLGFQLQSLHDFTKISRALIKDIFLAVLFLEECICKPVLQRMTQTSRVSMTMKERIQDVGKAVQAFESVCHCQRRGSPIGNLTDSCTRTTETSWHGCGRRMCLCSAKDGLD